MAIDLVFVFLVVLALFRGWRRGFIVAIFSLVSLFIGLAAAIKLSVVVAGWLDHSFNIAAKWLPLLSFLIVFLLVVLLVRMGAKVIESTVDWAMLGWLNKLGGIVFYLLIYIIVFSVLLFYAQKLNLIKPATLSNSTTYSFIQPWGPTAINGLGRFIPFFKGMFQQLEDFFGRFAGQFPSA